MGSLTDIWKHWMLWKEVWNYLNSFERKRIRVGVLTQKENWLNSSTSLIATSQCHFPGPHKFVFWQQIRRKAITPCQNVLPLRLNTALWVLRRYGRCYFHKMGFKGNYIFKFPLEIKTHYTDRIQWNVNVCQQKKAKRNCLLIAVQWSENDWNKRSEIRAIRKSSNLLSGWK